MAGTKSIKAGEAWWAITARDEATAVMDNVAKRIKSIGAATMLAGGAMVGAGLAVITPMLAAAKSFSDYVDGLSDVSITTGLSVESLSQLNFVAEQQGASLEGLKTGLSAMAKFTVAVASGGKGAVKVLNALGMSQAEFLSLDPEQRFRVLAEQISRIQDPTLRAGVAMKVFGRGAGELMPMLAMGSEGIAAMQKKAEALGLTVSQDMAKQFGSFGDELSAIGQQGKRIWFGFGAAMIEALTPFIPLIQAALRATIDFVDKNRQLIVMVIAGAAAFVFFGAVLTGVGGAIFIVGQLITAATWAVWLFSVACTAVGAVLAFITTPLGLVVVAVLAVIAVIAGAIAVFFTFTQAGQAMAARLSAQFGELFAVVKQTFGGIFDAIMAGDWGLAAEIGFAGIKVAWVIMVAALKDAWFGFVHFMSSILISGLTFVDGLIRSVLNGLIAAYNWAAEKMGLSTVKAVSEGTAALALLQSTLDAGLAGKKKESDLRIGVAKAELSALTAKAAAARKAREDSFKINVPNIPDFAAPDLSKLGGAGAGKGEGGGTLGTFNAAVAGMFNQSLPDHMEKVAENTEKTNDLLEEIRDKQGDGGLAWEN